MTDKVRQTEVTEEELMKALASRGSDVHEGSCVTPEVLNLLAMGRLEDEQSRANALRHFAVCDLCAKQLAQIKKSLQVRSTEETAETRRPVRKGYVIAFVATLFIAGVLWIVPRVDWTGPSSEIAVLDLRNDMLTRNVNPPFTIAHNARHLRIILPARSYDGEYDIEVFSRDGSSILKSSGVSKLSDDTVEILAAADFRAVQPGRYRLELRHNGSKPEAHFIQVK